MKKNVSNSHIRGINIKMYNIFHEGPSINDFTYLRKISPSEMSEKFYNLSFLC